MIRDQESKQFFFEKKNQKTFINLPPAYGTAATPTVMAGLEPPIHAFKATPHPTPMPQNKKSLFASFSSEKEVLPFFFGALNV